MKKLVRIYQSSRTHWVGDGFPVRSVFDYNGLGKELSPFVMNTHAEIQHAFEDYQLGRMGAIPAAVT